MKRTIKSVIMTVLLIYAGLCLLLYLGQRSILYYPTPHIPHDYGEIELDNDGLAIRVIAVNTNAAGAVIYFGGNGDAVAYHARDFDRLFPDRASYLMNYRGYGGSEGRPSEEGIYRDALKLYDHVAGDHDRVALIGRSLGCAVAAHVASRRPVDRLALITPFDSIEIVARGRYPFFPIRLLLRDKYRAAEYAPEIDEPVLVIVASEDTVIPRERTEALINAFEPEQLEVVVLEGAGHNSVGRYDAYYDSLAGFINVSP